jgi:hypothetical protein
MTPVSWGEPPGGGSGAVLRSAESGWPFVEVFEGRTVFGCSNLPPVRFGLVPVQVTPQRVFVRTCEVSAGTTIAYVAVPHG